MTKIQVVKELIDKYKTFDGLESGYMIFNCKEVRLICCGGYKITETYFNMVKSWGEGLKPLTDTALSHEMEDLRMKAEVNPYTVKPNKPGYIRCAVVKVLEKLKKDTTGYKLKASTLPQLSEQEHKDRHASYLHNSLASKNEVAFKPCDTRTQIHCVSPFIHPDYIFAGDFK